MSKQPGPEDAMWLYACPTCHARVGEHCRTPTGQIAIRTHRRRVALVPVRRKKGQPASSVRALSGGAFETNRRRH